MPWARRDKKQGSISSSDKKSACHQRNGKCESVRSANTKYMFPKKDTRLITLEYLNKLLPLNSAGNDKAAISDSKRSKRNKRILASFCHIYESWFSAELIIFKMIRTHPWLWQIKIEILFCNYFWLTGGVDLATSIRPFICQLVYKLSLFWKNARYFLINRRKYITLWRSIFAHLRWAADQRGSAGDLWDYQLALINSIIKSKTQRSRQ